MPANALTSTFTSIEPDEGKRRDLVAIVPRRTEPQLVVRAFDGRDGKVRWTWHGAASIRGLQTWLLDGDGSPGRSHRGAGSASSSANRTRTCGSWCSTTADARSNGGTSPPTSTLPVRILGLLRSRRPRRRRPRGIPCLALRPARAWDRDRKELWSWPDRLGEVELIFPASAGRSATVMLAIGAGPRRHDGPAAMGGPRAS